jgi:hypothetical protein
VAARKTLGKVFVLCVANVADLKSNFVEEIQIWKDFFMCLPQI